MNEPADLDPTDPAEFRCPQCGATLERKGKVIDCGTYKKWSEEWQCPVHGAVQPNREER